MLATNMAESGSPEEKLRWAFKMYDKDGSGEYQLLVVWQLYCFCWHSLAIKKYICTEQGL